MKPNDMQFQIMLTTEKHRLLLSFTMRTLIHNLSMLSENFVAFTLHNPTIIQQTLINLKPKTTPQTQIPTTTTTKNIPTFTLRTPKPNILIHQGGPTPKPPKTLKNKPNPP
jgi:hypothetical protein